MATIRIQSAVRYNRSSSRRIGWRNKFGQIVDLFGFHNRTPGEREFATAVSDWQEQYNRNGAASRLAVDGMLGPKTWRSMQPDTNFTPDHAVPPPAWLPAASNQPLPTSLNVAELDNVDRIGEALERSLPHLGPEAREEVEKLLDPATLAIVAGVLVAWIASHFVGIGEVVDVILLAVGVIAIGLAIFDGIDELYMFTDKAINARSEAHLDQAGKHFANAVAILGIQAVLAVLFKGAPKSFKGPRPKVGPAPAGKGIPKRIHRDPSMAAGEGATSWWGKITISPKGTAAQRRLAALHEKVHQILTPKLNVFRNFRIKGRAASYNKSSLSKYLEEAIAESVAQLGVNGFKQAFSGVTFPVKNGYVTMLRKAKDLQPVLPEAIGLVMGGFVVGGMRFQIIFGHNKPRPPEEVPGQESQ